MKNQVTILAISDTHSLLQPQAFQGFPQADILIHAGDFTLDSTSQQLSDFRQLLHGIDNIQKVIIPGNHEHIFNSESKHNQVTQQEIQEQRQLLKKQCHFLQFDLVNVKGLRILGISRWPQYFDYHFDFIPHLGKDIIEKYQGKVDVLITHWPPYGILDKVYNRQKGGSKGVLKFVKAIKPNIHIFGHIHEAYGFTEIDGIKFYNASYLNRQYQPKNKPFLITIPVTQSQKEQKQQEPEPSDQNA